AARRALLAAEPSRTGHAPGPLTRSDACAVAASLAPQHRAPRRVPVGGAALDAVGRGAARTVLAARRRLRDSRAAWSGALHPRPAAEASMDLHRILDVRAL